MSELKIVEYKTFVNHLQSGVITDAVVYDFMSEVEITYEHEGVQYGTKSPFGASQDNLLHLTFDNQGIKYTILSEKYGGEPSFMKSAEFGSLIFFAIPIILLIVVVVQATTIKKLASKLPDASNGT